MERVFHQLMHHRKVGHVKADPCTSHWECSHWLSGMLVTNFDFSNAFPNLIQTYITPVIGGVPALHTHCVNHLVFNPPSNATACRFQQ